MGGLLLPYSPRIPAPRFSMVYGDLGIAPEKALFATAEDLRRICAVPSDPGLLIDPS
jgi:hypothetical protein